MAAHPSVLIVEDDAFLLNMYADKFRGEGFEVLVATNGADAVKTAQSEAPDVILLDIMLPGMDGFEVLTALKGDAASAAIPVILLTNLSQKEDIDRGRQLGATDFLIKAHSMPHEVVARVRAVLEAA